MISAAATQCDHSSWKIERTAIQSLNWAAFLITRRRRGDRYTGGATVRLRLPYEHLRNFKTSKNVKSASLRFRPQNYIDSPMSVRLPLEGDEGMGLVMNYLTWYTLESSTICRIWDFVHNDVERHPVERLWVGDQGIWHQVMDFIHREIKGHLQLTMNILGQEFQGCNSKNLHLPISPIFRRILYRETIFYRCTGLDID